jgi:predicted Abi (CAAX) family protease
MLAVAYVCAVALAPLHHVAFGWQEGLPRVVQVPLNLVWIALIGALVAAFMAPLETLGWWAGWYGDRVVTAPAGDAGAPVPEGDHVKRYVVYLDGISQSSQAYMPDVEAFLDALVPRLPANVRLIRGLMAYSTINRPLDDDPVLAWFWRWVDKLRFANPQSLMGMLVNLRNVLIVAVSSDRRYGPIYNYGIGQLVYDALVASGYRKNSGTPVTFIGYSGGGQMAAASAAHVKLAIDAPVDVISLGGVISGNCQILVLEHLYHFFGDKDGVERLGPIIFPSRWKIAASSSWNRALRLGRLSIHGLGPVGHQVPGGLMDPGLTLPNGQTALEQTLDRIEQVLRDRVEPENLAVSVTPGNYGRYLQAAFNRPESYPIGVKVDAALYRPQAEWIGRLLLPSRAVRGSVAGAWFEVQHAPRTYAHLVGTTVKLQWSSDPSVQEMVRAVTRDVHFSTRADHSSRYDRFIQPVRVDHWQLVDPLEALAASHPVDDIVVALRGPVVVVEGADTVVEVDRQPVQITGRYRGLVKFVAPAGEDGYDVVHFNPTTRAFDGQPQRLRLPSVIVDDRGRPPSPARGWEHSPLNAKGWYVYGAPDESGTFVVQALLPRSVLTLSADRVVPRQDAYRYVHKRAWKDIVAHRGSAFSVQLGEDAWEVGDRALLTHVYGGIGGPRREKAASGPIYFGHFAFGFAEVVPDEHTGEPRFDFFYEQVYTHNVDGLVAGAMHMSRYLGDRQFGWAGLRPTCNVLLKLDAVSGNIEIDGMRTGSALDGLLLHLEAMSARYRIGDGSGCTYAGAANNCAQDSNQALFGALRRFDEIGDGAGEEPRLAQLGALVRDLRHQLQPFGSPRRDWSENQFNLGTTMSDDPIEQIKVGLSSWRVLLPRLASDTIVKTFLKNGATGWVIATGQLGERNDIRPIVPLTL